MKPHIGIVLLVHEALDRAAEVARFWHNAGCPVVIHVDARVPAQEFAHFQSALSDLGRVHFSDRIRCEWGTWSLVQASFSATEQMLSLHREVSHVFLASGACLPLRPVEDLERFIAAHPRTDFIESVAVEDVPWAKGGLDEERFEFTFPIAWKRHRRFFDAWVRLQRAFGRKRKAPDGIRPHLGSQWWCMTRTTLEIIMSDPRRQEIENYFRKVWIPDESYFQSLVRHYRCKVESRSLTLSKFDFQGKPHIFYDDHMDMLRRSECFVARKIWPHANALYAAFLSGSRAPSDKVPNVGEIDRTFARAVERRTAGRDGLNSAARFPSVTHEAGLTAAPYWVFYGLDALFSDFETWVAAKSRIKLHGHLFAEARAEFAEGVASFAGGLTDHATLRDYNPQAFLQNLIWNTRGETQGFLFGAEDEQKIATFLAKDKNATVYAVTGAWAVSLFLSGCSAEDARKKAAALQRREAALLEFLKHPRSRARVRVWTLAEFLDRPSEVLYSVVSENAPQTAPHLIDLPTLHDLTGLAAFLQDLKNQGMLPHLAGDVADVARVERPMPQTHLVR